MKKIFLILFFLSSTQPNFTFKELCDKIKLHAPKTSQILGISSLLILQAKNKKTLPFVRIFSLFKKLNKEIENRNISRIAHKIRKNSQLCTFNTTLVYLFKSHDREDKIQAQEERASQAWSLFLEKPGELEKKVYELQNREKQKASLFIKQKKRIEEGLEEGGQKRPFSDLFKDEYVGDVLIECTRDDYAEILYQDIIKHESENNFLSKFFCNFSKKLEYGLLFGELQFALYLLFVIYSSATHQD